jgi:hypothetical protein
LQADLVTTATGRQLLRHLLAEGCAERPLIDLGSSTVSGLRHGRPFASRSHPRQVVAHPVQNLRVVGPAEATALGSDTVRAGWAFLAPALDSAGSFTDAAGIRWVWADGRPSPLAHPLELAGVRGIRRHPRPQWPGPATDPTTDAVIQVSTGGDGRIVVIEPPCPGLLELAMTMRNPWQFMHDITDGWRVAGALLDWSLETLFEAYTRTLATLPEPPDVVVHADTLGFRAGMYLSVDDFRTQYRPRLGILLDRLRDLTGASVLLQFTGAVGPVLADLAGFEPDLLHLERDQAGLDPRRLRMALPARTALHGAVDLVRLGRALTTGDHALAAREAVLLADAWPAVVAPVSIVDAGVPPEQLARAASFVRGLSSATLRVLRGEPDPARVLSPLFCRGAGPARVELVDDRSTTPAFP